MRSSTMVSRSPETLRRSPSSCRHNGWWAWPARALAPTARRSRSCCESGHERSSIEASTRRSAVMAPAAVGTLAVTIFLVAGAAIWLIMVAVSLHQITFQLDTVLKAVTGIAGQVKAAPGVVSAIARDVGAIQSALH